MFPQLMVRANLQKMVTYHFNGVDMIIKDDYKKIEISINGEDSMVMWIRRCEEPLEANYVIFNCEGRTEIFELIDPKDVPFS